MVCAPVQSIIPSLKLGDYLSIQAHNPCSISHIFHYATEDRSHLSNIMRDIAWFVHLYGEIIPKP